MARLLIDQMTEDTLDPAKYPDRYRTALKKLLAKKGAAASRSGRRRTVAPEGEGRVIDLMDALRASVARRGRKVAAQETRRLAATLERGGSMPRRKTSRRYGKKASEKWSARCTR